MRVRRQEALAGSVGLIFGGSQMLDEPKIIVKLIVRSAVRD